MCPRTAPNYWDIARLRVLKYSNADTPVVALVVNACKVVFIRDVTINVGSFSFVDTNVAFHVEKLAGHVNFPALLSAFTVNVRRSVALLVRNVRRNVPEYAHMEGAIINVAISVVSNLVQNRARRI